MLNLHFSFFVWFLCLILFHLLCCYCCTLHACAYLYKQNTYMRVDCSIEKNVHYCMGKRNHSHYIQIETVRHHIIGHTISHTHYHIKCVMVLWCCGVDSFFEFCYFILFLLLKKPHLWHSQSHSHSHNMHSDGVLMVFQRYN